MIGSTGDIATGILWHRPISGENDAFIGNR